MMTYWNSPPKFVREHNDQAIVEEGIYRGPLRDDDNDLAIIVENPIDHSLWKWRLTPSGRPAALRRFVFRT